MGNISELVQAAKEKKPVRVLLQVPEGLKTRAAPIAEALEKAGMATFISAEPCYGACDIRPGYAKALGCDLIIHVGHSKFYKPVSEGIEVLYFPWKIDSKIDEKKLANELKKISEKRIGLATTVQYEGCMEQISAIIASSGKTVLKAGAILGCWTGGAEKIRQQAEAYLFFGSGEFHPSALFKLNRKIYFLDLEKNEIRGMENERVLHEKRRAARISAAADAETFAILVSVKEGQFGLAPAEKLKKRLEGKHKKAFIVIMDEIKDEKLLGIPADCFINTACPRIAEDKFSRTIINAGELEEMELL